MEKYPHVIYVYIVTNLINGKQYVGDHLSYRLDNLHKDSYFGSGKIIISAIKKYGIENFKKEILEYFPDKEKSFDAQEKYIKQYNTLVPNGYNISIRGGIGPKNTFKHTEKTKQQMSKSRLGMKHSIKTIDKMRAAKKDKKRGNYKKLIKI